MNLHYQLKTPTKLLGLICFLFSNFLYADFNDASQYNVYIEQDFESANTEVEGKLYTGNDAKLMSYAISSGITLAPEQNSLVVGGNLSFDHGKIYHGSAVAQGGIDNVTYEVLNGLQEGATVTGAVVFDKQAEIEFYELNNNSTQLSQAEINGVSEFKWNGLHLTGTCEEEIQVFNITTDDLADATYINASCIDQANAVVINITGAIGEIDNIGLQAFAPLANKTLWHFVDAIELSIGSVGLEGTVFAPKANVNGLWGYLHGTLIAKNYFGFTHFYHTPFTADISSLLSSEPPEITSFANYYGFENSVYQYDVDAVDPDVYDELAYTLAQNPNGMSIDAQTGEISWVADKKYVGSVAQFNSQCYVVPTGSIEVLLDGQSSQASSNYIAPLFLEVKEAIHDGGEYTSEQAISWDEQHQCLGCHIQSQSLLGLVTSQDKADVPQEGIDYLLNEFLTSQQTDGSIIQSHPQYAKNQTALAIWAMSKGIDPEITIDVRANALNFMQSKKQGSDEIYWTQDHPTGWLRNPEAMTSIMAYSIAYYLKDIQLVEAPTQFQLDIADQYLDNVDAIVRYFISDSYNDEVYSLFSAYRLIAISELLEFIQDETLKSEVEQAKTHLDQLLRSRQQQNGGWTLNFNSGTSDPMTSAWVGLALNYLNPSITDKLVIDNINYLLDAQEANGTWDTNSGYFSTDLGTTSLVMSYLPIALEHLGNPDVRVSDILLRANADDNLIIQATIKNRGLADITSDFVIQFLNENDDLIGESLFSGLNSNQVKVATAKIEESQIVGDIIVKVVVPESVEECTINNNEARAATVNVLVHDKAQNSDNQWFSVNILDVNAAPVITSEPPAEQQGGQSIEYQVTVEDEDIGDAAVFELTDAPEGIYIDSRTGLITSDPEILKPGIYSVTVLVTDLRDESVEQTFTFEVFENLAPSIVSSAVSKGHEQLGYIYDVQATDPNNDELEFGFENNVHDIVIDKNSGQITWNEASKFVDVLINQNLMCEKESEIISEFNVVEKWRWTHSDLQQSDVYGPPMVAQFTDDNADGLINEDDDTDIIFYSGHHPENEKIRIVDGATGVEHLVLNLPISMLSSPAVGDLNRDGIPEFVAVSKYRESLMLISNTGEIIWQSNIPNLYTRHTPRDGINLADLDHDGISEIILGDLVYDFDGNLLWNGVNDFGGELDYGIVSVVEDIDLDGEYEIIAGRSVYNSDGSLKWHASSIPSSGINAVANFDNDDEAEIVLVANSKVYLLDTDGTIIWGPISLPGGGVGGPPTIADVDGDGVPEIAVAGAKNYVVFNSLGDVLWKHDTIDSSSFRTGSSFFDFEGDGKSEVLYADEYNFYIFEGATGDVIYEQAKRTGTVLEYPVVADVDNDGHAEIVLGENSNSKAGLFVLEGSPEWLPTRRIWNQYSYSVNNVNDDLTIPSEPSYPWLTHNTFRLNTFIDRPALAQADLIVHSIKYNEQNSEVTLTVKNRGLTDSTETTINVFHEHFWLGDTDLGLIEVPLITPNTEIELTLPINELDISEAIRAEINTDQSVVECDYTNNTARAAVVDVRVYDLAGLWDSQKFAISFTNHNDAPQIISATVSSISAELDYSFKVEVSDPDLGDAFSFGLINEENVFEINKKTGIISAENLVEGSYLLEIKVTDLAGASATQFHTVTVTPDGNLAPTITSLPTGNVTAFETYTYQVEATDPEAQLIAYVLSSAPEGMTIDPQTGLLQWSTDFEDVGVHYVRVIVLDELNASTSQTFDVEVYDPYASNAAPVITSVPEGAVFAGKEFKYQVIAIDADGDSLNYTIESNEQSMKIDQNGLFTWIPIATLIGEVVEVTITVDDGRTGATSQRLSLPVNESANHAPTISSEPTYAVEVNTLYQYQLNISDSDGDSWTSTLLEFPAGMVIENDLIYWTPSDNQSSQIHEIKINVEDERGAIAQQSYSVFVNKELPPNSAPEVLSAPTSPAFVDVEYQYQMVVFDADNDEVTYSLVDSQEGMFIDKNGLFSWTPTLDQIGTFSVQIKIQDQRFFVTHNYMLQVVDGIVSQPGSNDNNYPEILSTPSYVTAKDENYIYQVVAKDADNDALFYELTSNPDGMTITEEGFIQWSPTQKDLGSYSVVVSVNDTKGITTQSFELIVKEELAPLSAQLHFGSSQVYPGDELTLFLVHDGGRGSVVKELTFEGEIVNLSPYGQGSIIVPDIGQYEFAFNVSDIQSNVAGSKTLNVSDPNDSTAPEIELISPEISATIKNKIDVVGSVFDVNLQSYTLSISSKGKDNWIELAKGYQNKDAEVLGQIDATIMRNGMYDLKLEAQDSAGFIRYIIYPITIDGDLKIGEFAITQTDFEIPVMGIPVSFSRTYDSRRRLENLELGYGWSASYNDIEIQESVEPTDGWKFSSEGAPFKFGGLAGGAVMSFPAICMRSVKDQEVTITLPNGDIETFVAKATRRDGALQSFVDEECYIAGGVFGFTITFESKDDSKATLEALDAVQYFYDANTNVLSSELVFPEADDLSVYKLTTRNGFEYLIDQYNGIQSITDPNGNKLDYSDTEISHSAGQKIQIIRDQFDRITTVIDPKGNEYTYEYDAQTGDLINVIDPVGAITNFVYSDTGKNDEHFLTDIIDPLGRGVVKNIYEDGRLIAQEDADGNRTDFNHDLEGRQSIIKDRNGNVTVYHYDENGNVLTTTDAYGHITSYTYDADDNELSMTNALGFTTQATYNEDDDVLTQTDELGNTTTYTYNDKGDELTIVDAKGHVWENTYDSVGNLTGIKGPDGNSFSSTLDWNGNLSTTTDAAGNKTSYTYNSKGSKLSETNALGHKSTYTYDSNDNMLSGTMTRTVVDPADSSLTILLKETTSYEYDKLDRLIKTTYPDGRQSESVYDLMGNEVLNIDMLGRTTQMEYDAYNQVIKTIYADGSFTEKTYDKMNNVLSETDVKGNVTTFEYDKLNRLVKTVYADNSEMQTVYDAIGRVEKQIDALGNESSFEYDEAGRRTKTISYLVSGNIEHSYEYDTNGNVLAEIDNLGRRTEYEYDENDQKVKTTFNDLTFIETQYDALGRRVKEIDQAGIETEYGYDAIGRLISVTDHQGNITSYTYDEQGNKLSQSDAKGQTTLWTYDDNGREISRQLPMGQIETYAYDYYLCADKQAVELNQVDALCMQTTHTDFNGDAHVYFYDISDRLFETGYADGSFEINEFDVAGQVIQTQTQEGIWNYEYDFAGRLLSETQPNGSVLHYSYDIAGNKTQFVLEMDSVEVSKIIYTYDELNRLSTVREYIVNSVVLTEAKITSYGYDEVGNRHSVLYPNGVSQVYVYDELNRLKTLNTFDQVGVLMDSFSYEVGVTGRRDKVVEYNGREISYQYDDHYRLTNEDVIDAVNGNYSATYTHGFTGNRLTKNDGEETAYVYDANDRVISEVNSTTTTEYVFDDNGNTIQVLENGLVTIDYEYNSLNKLVKAELETQTIEFTYNASGIRIGKTVTDEFGVSIEIQYIVDMNQSYAQVVGEVVAGELAVTYQYGDDLISQNRIDTDITVPSYYIYDGLGSTRSLVDESGIVSDSYNYDAFGELLNSVGVTDNAYLYTGEQFDEELDQYYLRARYYDQGVGRFTQQDVYLGNSQDPITLHKYLYANADPVMYTDPSGYYAMSLSGFSVGFSIQGILRSTMTAGLMVSTAGGVALGITSYFEYALGFPVTTQKAEYDINQAAMNLAVSKVNTKDGKNIGHHSIPVYMCGAEEASRQQLVPLKPLVHTALHSAMVTYNAAINTAYKKYFKGTNKIFSYSNKEPIQLLAETPKGRAVIAKHLELFYSFGWFELGEPYFRGIFDQEKQKYISGVTSLPNCKRGG
ncbi:choice-of-anchor A family protein [Marinicellulosiphila megalodicopiae]|uniref:choice-of-anchor A family protein n=1 Tax=Marinicellulosiphila megalodicopiae TaxID=2724896 RepID=UPI003BB0FA2F